MRRRLRLAVVEFGFGEALCCSLIRNRVAELLKIKVCNIAEAGVFASRYDYGDLLLAALNEDRFVLSGVDQRNEFRLSIDGGF